MDNKITSDDLRGMLDEYSPEQLMENDAKLISEGAKTLADVSAHLKECMDALPILVHNLQKATALHISEESITTVLMSGEEAGKAAANAFKKSVEATVKNARRSIKHVSCPAFVALVLLSFFITLVFFTGIMVYLNCVLWNNDLMWKAIWLSLGIFIFLILVTAFMNYMEWI